MRIAAAPNGEMADIVWSNSGACGSYEAVPEDGEWLMATGAERALIERLARDCMRLDNSSLTTDIFVKGFRLGPIRFSTQMDGSRSISLQARKSKGRAFEVEIEDAIMHPILSGPEAKRYEEPNGCPSSFPYSRSGNVVRLITSETMQSDFPKLGII